LTGLAIVSVVAILSGCGGGKLSAQQAAKKLAGIVATGSKIHCVPARDGWDYACRVKPPGRAAFTTDVDVSDEQVTNISG